MRDFCRVQAKHKFLAEGVAVADTRFAHFDIIGKVAAVEIEGIDAPLRFDDMRAVFESQAAFSATSAVAKRIHAALDFLARAFPKREGSLKSRTIVQTIITFACRLVETKKSNGLEKKTANFIRQFMKELSHQVELGQAATDYDFIRFQKSVNANVRGGARIRQEVLLRKAFLYDPDLADAFDSSAVQASGISARVKELGNVIAAQIGRLNSANAAKHGEDLFKSTNKTSQALLRLGKPVSGLGSYKEFIDNLYFIFREGVGQRLSGRTPESFNDVNSLRTDLQHDVDHGEKGKVVSKRKKIGQIFSKYSGAISPEVLDPSRFVLVQANLLTALELDLQNLVV